MKYLYLTSILVLLSLSMRFSQAGIITDGSMGEALTLAGPNYAIKATLGQQQGGHLFHSFSDFELNTGEAAVFSGPSTINHIISRVTGGLPSRINGRLQSDIPQANFYFFNPAGLWFGESAALELSGGFYASTADYLQWADGRVFDAHTPQNSQFSSAAPSAFGFVANNAALEVQGSRLLLAPFQSLSLSGANIQLTQAQIIAPAGQLHLNSVSGAAVVPFEPSQAPSAALGDLNVENSALSVTSEGGGRIDIHAGRVSLLHSVVTADSESQRDSGNIAIQASHLQLKQATLLSASTFGEGDGGHILLESSGDIELLEGSSIVSVARGAGAGGNLQINTPAALVLSGERPLNPGEQAAARFNSSIIGAYTSSTTHPAAAGQIDINAGRLQVSDGGLIATLTAGLGQAGETRINIAGAAVLEGQNSSGERSGILVGSEYPHAEAGDGGHLELQADSLALREGAIISGDTQGGGAGGNITVRVAQNIQLSGESQTEGRFRSSLIGSITNSQEYAGSAGTVLIEAGALQVSDGGLIGSLSTGIGKGNTTRLDIVKAVVLDGENSTGERSGILVGSEYTAENAGPGGGLSLQAESLSLQNGAMILGNTLGGGHGGDISIQVDNTLSLSGSISEPLEQFNSSIIGSYTSSTTERAEAGKIDINAGSLQVSDGGLIATLTAGLGQAGETRINIAGAAVLEGQNSSGERSGILVGSEYPHAEAGDGGHLELQADSLALREGAIISGDTQGGGAGGNITVRVAQNIQLSGESQTEGRFRSSLIGSITNSQEYAGSAGTVLIEAGALQVSDGGLIGSLSTGIGKGNTTRLDIVKAVVLDGENSTGERSGILVGSEYTAENAGPGGGLSLQAESLSLQNGAMILGNTLGGGHGGDISIQVDNTLSLSGGIRRPLGRLDSSLIGAYTLNNEYSAPAGRIDIQAGRLDIKDGGTIGTLSAGRGNGNTTRLAIQEDLIMEGSNSVGDVSLITAGSLSEQKEAGLAGDIEIQAQRLLLSGGSQITTRTQVSDAGDIHIENSDYLYLQNNSSILTAVGAAKGDGGNIFIEPGFIILKQGFISANAAAGDGGNISIDTDGIYQFDQTPLEQVITASSERGISGEIQLSSPEVDISGSLSVLPAQFSKASDLQQTPCTPQRAAAHSRFIVRRYAGKRAAPGDWRSGACLFKALPKKPQ